MKTCNRCVMNDSADKTIVFDENGDCNYCTQALKTKTSIYFPNDEGSRRLEALLRTIKDKANGRKYDCIMGLSGGLDSSYLLYLGYKWGLRVLVIHIDDGFDTEISQQNIVKLIDKTGFEMKTVKPDGEQFCDLLRAYMLAGVPNIAVPQDNVLFAYLYDEARKNKINYFLSGGNFALESILQHGNTHDALDMVNIKDIHRKYGTMPINKLKFISSYRKYYDMKVCGLKTLRPLDLIDYNRSIAFEQLNNFCGFEYYGSKHLENVFTAFVQLYWLPKKFGVDKRTSHLSSMIISGQISRDEALAELGKPAIEDALIEEYVQAIKTKLNLSDSEFESIMNSPARQHCYYKTDKVAKYFHKILS